MTTPRTAPLRPYIPAGCDQQGRHPEAAAPAPAEAATDIGIDDYEAPDPVRSVLIDAGICCVILAIVYLILWAVVFG